MGYQTRFADRGPVDSTVPGSRAATFESSRSWAPRRGRGRGGPVEDGPVGLTGGEGYIRIYYLFGTRILYIFNIGVTDSRSINFGNSWSVWARNDVRIPDRIAASVPFWRIRANEFRFWWQNACCLDTIGLPGDCGGGMVNRMVETVFQAAAFHPDPGDGGPALVRARSLLFRSGGPAVDRTRRKRSTQKREKRQHAQKVG